MSALATAPRPTAFALLVSVRGDEAEAAVFSALPRTASSTVLLGFSDDPRFDRVLAVWGTDLLSLSLRLSELPLLMGLSVVS